MCDEAIHNINTWLRSISLNTGVMLRRLFSSSSSLYLIWTTISLHLIFVYYHLSLYLYFVYFLSPKPHLFLLSTTPTPPSLPLSLHFIFLSMTHLLTHLSHIYDSFLLRTILVTHISLTLSTRHLHTQPR
jgi:hypothetical protein